DAGLARARQALALIDASDALTLINAETAVADSLTGPSEALARYEGVVARCVATYGESHALTAAFQRRAAAGLLRVGLAAAALPLLQRARATCEAVDPDAGTTAETHQLLADATLALGDHEAALA